MNSKFIYILFLFVSLQLRSQKQVDSLKLLLKHATSDTLKLKLYSQISEVCDEKDIALYTKPGIELSEKILKNTDLNLPNNASVNLDLNNNIPPKLKKSVLNYYSRLLNSAGIFEISHGNNQAGISIFEKALKAQTLNNDTLQMASTLNNIGINLYYMGDIKKSMDAINQSLKFYNYLKDKRGISQCYNGLSIISRSQGDILKGIDYIFKSLKISETLRDEDAISNLYNSLSVYYLDLEDYNKALEYGEKSIELSKKLDLKRTLSNAYNGVAFVYKKRNELDKSLHYLDLSLKISEELGDKNQLVTAYNNLGVLYKDKKNYADAINYYKKSLQIAIEIGATDGVANSNYKLGEVYLLQNNMAKALPFALKSYQISKQLATPVDIRNSAELLKKIYENTRQYQQALEMTTIYYTMRDSISNNTTKNEALKKQFKYDYDKKAISDSIKLVEQKKITSSQLALQQAEIKSQTTIRIALIAGIVAIAIFLIFVVNRLQITKKQKLIIEQQTKITQTQKNELETKNKNILEGIQAAKDIQYSVFPNKAELENVFKNYFILFKPFDKLSGDFLWLKTVKDKTFFVVGDCTGHGIPASLLTLLANEFLNKIILQKQITSASKILHEVNVEIYNYLQRKQKLKRSINEGMDIAICIIDIKQNIFTYSGAKIDLYTISTNNELIITQSHKVELGKQQTLNEVHEQTFKFTDTKGFFLTTDGFKDQLKYRSNKTKFGFNGFENFIKNNVSVSFLEQKNTIENLYTQSISNEKQIDDILVFGFKI